MFFDADWWDRNGEGWFARHPEWSAYGPYQPASPDQPIPDVLPADLIPTEPTPDTDGGDGTLTDWEQRRLAVVREHAQRPGGRWSEITPKVAQTQARLEFGRYLAGRVTDDGAPAYAWLWDDEASELIVWGSSAPLP